MGEFETIRYDVDSGIGVITLDRPAVLNAFNTTMIDELNHVLYEADRDEAVYVIILTGAGRAFCAGVDTTEVLGPSADRDRLYNEVRLTKTERIFQLLHTGTTPTIAAVNGPTVGGGVGFTLFCDFRVMSETAFLQDQHINLGLPATPEAWMLAKLVGESTAKEFIFLRDRITPEMALDAGLVLHVAAAGETLADARAVAETLRDKPRQGIAFTKENLGRDFGSLAELLSVHREHHYQVLADPEHEHALSQAKAGDRPRIDRDY